MSTCGRRAGGSGGLTKNDSNPDTLHANLEVITNTHTIERFALFDQFPYVHHTECGVFLKKKAANGHEA